MLMNDHEHEHSSDWIGMLCEFMALPGIQYNSFQSKNTLAGRKKQPQLCTLTTFDNFYNLTTFHYF